MIDNPWNQALDPQVNAAIAYLRSPKAIRERCGQIFQLACEDRLHHFACDLTQLGSVADYVIQVTRHQYPDLDIPYHSRWRHFAVGNMPRLVQLEQALAELTPVERARSKFDLVVTSVLLDAGAGGTWNYFEPDGQVWQRSEGLAVASFHLFCQGGFSSNPHQPYQVDAQRLQTLTQIDLIKGFQVSVDNPMVGIPGRLTLLQQLGRSLLACPQLFGSSSSDSGLRPGNLVYYLLSQAPQGKLAASTVLEAVLVGLSDIWPGRGAIAGVNLGDVWPHPGLKHQGLGKSLIPFHKLSQWLTYSLIEPLQELGLEIIDLDMLTGLPEYRNGGLCLDLGLLKPKHAGVWQEKHSPGSEVIVEWRALTVILLDRIAEQVRQQLDKSAQDLPLAKVLQGGTWAAGRQIAKTLRPAGEPPIQLESDGTVF